MEREIIKPIKIFNIILSAITIILIFSNWLTQPYFGSYASILEVSDFLRVISVFDVVESAIISIIISLCIITAITLEIVFIMCISTKQKGTSLVCTLSSVFNIIASISFFILVVFINSGISYNSFGINNSFVSTTYVPYLVIVLSIVKRAILFVKIKEKAPKTDEVSDAEKIEKICPVCGAANIEEANFCKDCGADLDSLVIEEAPDEIKLCRICENEITNDMTFCINCGAKIEE